MRIPADTKLILSDIIKHPADREPGRLILHATGIPSHWVPPGKLRSIRMEPSMLKAIREQRGWTQAAMADACGVSQAAIAQWESGRTYPNTQSLRLLYHAL